MKYGLSDEVVNNLISIFCRYKKVEKVIIFGSRAKGNFRTGSDIDFAVSGTDIDYSDLLAISTDIDDLELLYRIDLIDYKKKQNTPIGEHINRVGKTFYERGITTA